MHDDLQGLPECGHCEVALHRQRFFGRRRVVCRAFIPRPDHETQLRVSPPEPARDQSGVCRSVGSLELRKNSEASVPHVEIGDARGTDLVWADDPRADTMLNEKVRQY